jgi:hypothetical protein
LREFGVEITELPITPRLVLKALMQTKGMA